MTEFRPEDILRALDEHGVRFVLIGGLAAVLHGSALPTYDMDITPEPSAANLARLSDALRALDARVRVDGVDGGLAFRHDAESLAGVTTLDLVTSAGDLDVVMAPAGLPESPTGPPTPSIWSCSGYPSPSPRWMPSSCPRRPRAVPRIGPCSPCCGSYVSGCGGGTDPRRRSSPTSPPGAKNTTATNREPSTNVGSDSGTRSTAGRPSTASEEASSRRRLSR